ncbi:Tyrosine-sulfated glycopeptide receptor 1 [Morella rubra]|uniref:Tyrosine-sulfated glycopeptide receptor 1 n=1 Tax=Morella rubra TaxID=262757 RepID=A0A6A1WT31_9ROSI|nr:Tyrosine-sulfated glycopeptide receptor 1 [Morella rubra]
MGLMTSQTIPTDDSIAHSDGFKNVQLLSLECQLTGQLPTWLSNLKKLEILVLNSTVSQVQFPVGFQPFQGSRIWSCHNHFSGEFPKELCALPALISAQALENDTSSLILPLFSILLAKIISLDQYPQAHLQSFGPSTYEGNAGLCGAPLPKECTHIVNSNEEGNSDEKVGGHRIPWFPITVVLGFITGFWGVCGSLVLNRNWRNAIFDFLKT